MKRGLIIGVIVVVIIAIALGIYFYPSGEEPEPTPSNCAEAGQSSSNPSLGPDDNPINCCEGLVEISSAPESGFKQIGDEYLPAPGFGLMCSDCGNGNCENWEHQYNCPEDCA